MFPLAALLLVAQVDESGALPDRQMLNAFEMACAHVEEVDQMLADARATGWEDVAEDAHPQLAALNRHDRQVMGDSGQVRATNFRRAVADRTLFLVISRSELTSGVWGNYCRLYHFDAAAPLDLSGLEDWIGQPPTDVQEDPDLMIKYSWVPGWRDGTVVNVSHVPQDSRVRNVIGLSGNVLGAETLGGF